MCLPQYIKVSEAATLMKYRLSENIVYVLSLVDEQVYNVIPNVAIKFIDMHLPYNFNDCSCQLVYYFPPLKLITINYPRKTLII